jgi:hypothetical protein
MLLAAARRQALAGHSNFFEKKLAPDVTSDFRIRMKGDRRLKNGYGAMYLAQQFAERAGVTVRTLHHYDRMGLLKPSGYRS